MKHQILNYAGDLLGTIDIDELRAAQIVVAKAEINQHNKMCYGYSVDTWHFLAGDWLTDSEIENLGTSHELEVQIIPATERGAA